MTKDKIIRIRVPNIMVAKIDAEAERRGKNRSSMTRYILERYFDSQTLERILAQSQGEITNDRP